MEDIAVLLANRLMEIERRLWSNDADCYAAQLAPDALLVFAETGPIGRDAAIEAIREENAAGRRWTRVDFDDVRHRSLDERTALLSYRVRACWSHENHFGLWHASSVYVMRQDQWKLAFHQQTPVVGGAVDTSDPAAGIRRSILDWAAAVGARRIDGVVSGRAADIVMFDVPPPARVDGLDAYRRTWDDLFAWFDGDGVFELRDLHVEAGTDLAFAYSIVHCRPGNPGAAGEALDVRLTLCLRKHGNDWIVAHEHHSIPAPHAG